MSKGRKKLTFSRWDLTEKQFDWFEGRGLLLQDYKSCFMSPETLADTGGDGEPGEEIFPIGVTLDEDGLLPADAFDIYKGYPESFWKEIGLPEDVRKEIEEFWKDNPEGEVEWEA